MADQTSDGASRGERDALDLDPLAVSDRFRLFNFTRRDDHVAYLWVLRALDRLRAVHQVQAHTDDVAAALAELAAVHDEVPGLSGTLREKLDALAEDGMVHRLEDASRAGSLARYRNRQSVYQFSELGYRAFTAVEGVLGARIRDANLSRLVFSDILDDLKALAAATRAQDAEQVYRRLSRLDTVLDDMSRRAARFHLTLGEIIRSTDTSPDTFLRYKNALLTHMTDFMAELDRYLPRLAAAVAEADGAAGGQEPDAMPRLAAQADERPFLSHDELVDDWRRRWAALRAWFADDSAADDSATGNGATGDGAMESRAEGLRTATRAAVSAVIALLRQVTEAQRGGVNRSSQLRHLAEWVFSTPDEGAAYALMSAAFNIRSVRHLGAAHDDAEQISSRAPWWDAPGVEISVTLFRRGKAPTPGVPQPARANPAVKAELRRRQAAERQAEREAAHRLLQAGAHDRVLDDTETKVLLRLLTLATEARTVVAGRLAAAAGGSDVLTMRLIPSPAGSAVRTASGVLHLPGFELRLEPAGRR
ncbi:MAG TPA: TIGR02677 family protein [Streptosporangiaceae bacterium]|nr:TIGR02677 family protein [Streptosporangiaceae bacterium]